MMMWFQWCQVVWTPGGAHFCGQWWSGIGECERILHQTHGGLHVDVSVLVGVKGVVKHVVKLIA